MMKSSKMIGFNQLVRQNQIGEEIVSHLKHIVEIDNKRIYYFESNIEILSKTYSEFFTLSLNRLKKLRPLSKLHVLALFEDDQLVSMALFEIKNHIAEIINIETIQSTRRKGYAKVLIQNFGLLKLLHVKKVISRNRTQWIDHPEWESLLTESKYLLKNRVMYTYISSIDKKEYITKEVLLPKGYSRVKVSEYGKENFLKNYQEIRIESIPNYLQPDKVIHKSTFSPTTSFLIMKDKQIIGWFLSSLHKDKLLVDAFYILPNFRNYNLALAIQKMFIYENQDLYELGFMVRAESKFMKIMAHRLFKPLNFEIKEQAYYTMDL